MVGWAAIVSKFDTTAAQPTIKLTVVFQRLTAGPKGFTGGFK